MTTGTPFTEDTLLENYRAADDEMQRLILRVADADTEADLLAAYRRADPVKRDEIERVSFHKYLRTLP